MKLKKSIIKLYKKLPEWVKKDLIDQGGTGWLYTGSEILGWDWVADSNDMEIEYSDSDFIPTESYAYLGYIKDLLLPLSEEIETIVKEDGKDMIIGFNIINRDQENEEVMGRGFNRLSAMLNLLDNISEFYWNNHCPSLNDVHSDNNISFAFEDIKTEVEVFENKAGNYSITFNNYHAAGGFMERFSRFVESRPETQNGDYSSESYFGTMNMVEGKTEIYSNYGKEHDPSYYNSGGLVVGTPSNNILNGKNPIIGGYPSTISPGTNQISLPLTQSNISYTGSTGCATGTSNYSGTVKAGNTIKAGTCNIPGNVSNTVSATNTTGAMKALTIAAKNATISLRGFNSQIASIDELDWFDGSPKKPRIRKTLVKYKK